MNPIILWNCRGLGNPATINALNSLVRKYSPDVLFLSETKCNKSDICRVQSRLRFDKSVCVEAHGRAGGLALFWTGEVEVKIQGMDDHFIDVQIREDCGRSWRLSGIYGWSEGGKKHNTWEMINSLGINNIQPWLLGGDYNEVLRESEKRGGVGCDFNNICAFRDCLALNGLREIESSGLLFTWNNRRSDGFIEEKLDRCVANERWYVSFPLARVENVTWDGSDHCPMVLFFKNDEGDRSRLDREENKLFRFEAQWLQHDFFQEFLRGLWESSKDQVGLSWCKRVDFCGSQLKIWHKDVYSGSQNRLGWLLKRLKVVRKMPPSPAVIEEYRSVEHEIRGLRRQQETGVWQRCRPFVLKDGDKNSAYFHSKVAMRRRRNKLKGLVGSYGIKE